MALTHNAANALLEVLCGKRTTAPYSNTYIGLSSTQPNVNGTGYTEPTVSSYKRQRFGSTSTPAYCKMGTASGGVIKNDNASNEYGGKIFWEELQPGEVYPECKYILIFGSQSGSDLLAYAELETPVTPAAGSIPLIPVGSITISLT